MLTIIEDIKAIYRNDPAVRNIEFLLYPGLHAILVHRFCHFFWKLGIPFFPRLFSQVSRFLSGLSPARLNRSPDSSRASKSIRELKSARDFSSTTA